LTDRLAVFHGERAALEKERRELSAKTQAGTFDPIQNTARDKRASEILDGSAVVEPTDSERLAAVSQRLGDLTRAIEMLTIKIDAEGRRASALIAEQISGVHKDLVSQMCAALISAHRANQKYHAFADTLNSERIEWGTLFPMQPNNLLGDPRDNYSGVALYLKEAAAHGYINADTVPLELRA
jgi:hypothetical protein